MKVLGNIWNQDGFYLADIPFLDRCGPPEDVRQTPLLTLYNRLKIEPYSRFQLDLLLRFYSFYPFRLGPLSLLLALSSN